MDIIDESERQFDEQINNKIVDLTGQITGPLSSQVSEDASAARYSSINLDQNKNLINYTSTSYAEAANIIFKISKRIRYCNTAYELLTVINDLVLSIDRKLK
jgi:hypothetical protein